MGIKAVGGRKDVGGRAKPGHDTGRVGFNAGWYYGRAWPGHYTRRAGFNAPLVLSVFISG
jgi:hypothetical protein